MLAGKEDSIYIPAMVKQRPAIHIEVQSHLAYEEQFGSQGGTNLLAAIFSET